MVITGGGHVEKRGIEHRLCSPTRPNRGKTEQCIMFTVIKAHLNDELGQHDAKGSVHLLRLLLKLHACASMHVK
jgi:hypothetical protein